MDKIDNYKWNGPEIQLQCSNKLDVIQNTKCLSRVLSTGECNEILFKLFLKHTKRHTARKCMQRDC